LSNQEFAKELIEKKAPGNWYSSMNVSNLINGNTVPRDPYVFLILAEMLEESVSEIIKRYSNINN
jgi:hypothetical protein